MVFQGKEKTALLFTAQAATGATWQCLFRKPACVYLLTGLVLSHETRQLAHCALRSLHNYPILPPAASTPPALVMVPLHGVLYFLPFYETFNAVQAEIWGKIPDPILEISYLQLQGLLPLLAEHFELQKSSGRWWQSLRSLTICKTYDGVALIFARRSVFHLIPIWPPLQGFWGKGWGALISSSSVQYRTMQGIILLSESPDVTFPRLWRWWDRVQENHTLQSSKSHPHQMVRMHLATVRSDFLIVRAKSQLWDSAVQSVIAIKHLEIWDQREKASKFVWA